MFTQTVSLCTGINQLASEASLSVFPNPFVDTFTIKTAYANYGIIIIDVLGKVVYEKQISTSETEIDMSNLNAGFYQLKVKSENNTYVQKIIKQ
jgi:hypothetical protein